MNTYTEILKENRSLIIETINEQAGESYSGKSCLAFSMNWILNNEAEYRKIETQNVSFDDVEINLEDLCEMAVDAFRMSPDGRQIGTQIGNEMHEENRERARQLWACR